MNELQPLLDLLQAKFGWAPAVLGWIAALRLALKPFGRGIGVVIQQAIEFCRSAGPGEVSRLDRIMESWVYRLFAFSVDLFCSVKLPLHVESNNANVDVNEQKG